VVAVAGADRDGPQDLANATSDLIQHVSAAHDANAINVTPVQNARGLSLTEDTKYVAQVQPPSDSQPSQKTKPENLPSPGN
jgi:hypothetical protein